MAAAPCPRRLPRLLGAAVVLALTAGVWGLSASPSRAATTHTVEVQNRSGGTLHPASLQIQVGDTVVWQWVANEYHAVTVTGHGSTTCNPLDSAHAPCDGHTLEITFEEAGEFAVRDDAPFGSTGTVVVAAPPPPKPTPPPPSPTASSPSPSDPPRSDPGASEPSEPRPTPAAPSTEPSPPPTTDPPPPQPTTGTAAPPPVDTEPDPTPTAGDPAVASADDSPSPVPDPTFEDFPEPVDPTPADDVEGEVAVGSPADDGARVVWGVVGGLTVLGTLGAFGRAVLFSGPWEV